MVTSYSAGAVTLVNTNNQVHYQIDQKIVTHPGGGYTIVWADIVNPTGASRGIYQQRFDDTGTAVSSITLVSPVVTGDWTPMVTGLSNGDYVVAWNGSGQDGSGGGIYAQRFNSSGVPQGGELDVSTTNAGDQGWNRWDAWIGLSITDLGSAGFVVTWEGNGTQTGQVDTSGIFAQRFDLSGNKVGTETLVNTTTANAQTNPSVSAFSDGSYVITWASNLQDGSGWGVYAQRFNVSGVKVGSETLVNSYTAGNQGIPFVAVLNNDDYVISWTSTGQDGSDNGVYAQRFNASGTALGVEFRVNTFTADAQDYGRVTALADGGFLIAWTSNNQDYYNVSRPDGAYMQRYDADGNTVGFETLVNNVVVDNQNHPVFGETANGNFVAAWTHATPYHDIYQQVFTNTTVTGGAEIYYGTIAHDTVDGGAGNDTIYTGGGNDTLWGSAGNDLMSGDAGNDILYGGADNDTLHGGLGADTMDGGTGNDTYYVENLSDVVVEAAGEGSDKIISAVLTSLIGINEVEHLDVTGTANVDIWGNDHANIIGGTDGGNNAIYGGNGNDSLYGLGGNDTIYGEAGNDYMYGGAGNDVYYVDSTSDVVIDTANYGYDIVYASADFDLNLYTEELHLTGAAIMGRGDSDANIITGTSANNVLYGDAGADTLDGGAGADTMYGGMDTDVYIVDNVADVIINYNLLNHNLDVVYSYVTYTLSDNLGDLNLYEAGGAIDGTGNGAGNYMKGNSFNNVLRGEGGNDKILGFGGNDTLIGGVGANTLAGGTGDDVYYLNTGTGGLDTVTENVGEGVDWIHVGANYQLNAWATQVENLQLTGTAGYWVNGNALDNTILGNSGNNSLYGYDGSDWLDGGAGADTLGGMKGNDTYVVDSLTDSVGELANEGTDRVRSSVTWTLGANFENLTLTGTDTINGTGNSVANDMLGNIAANLLTSYDGNDTLDGGGGADTLVGGLGNDLYRVDNTGDIVTELSGEGTDTIEATADYSLAGVDNIEALNLVGSGNINVTGNANANVLNGNSGNNILDGGAGADTLTGGAGDDTYIVDDAGDVFTEATGAGADTVVINASHTLSANFENLTLTGAAALTGTGNSADNVITGNDGDNTLSGADGNDTLDGGLGADSLVGGLGNDTYVIDNSSDVIVENAGEGTDTVRSYLSHTLAADFEHLTLLGSATDGTGNAGANAITGNASANTLDGAAGADTLSGGAGNDTYYVDDAGDVVVENASEGTDTIHASVSFNAASNVENVVLTGSGNISSTGNSQANTLTGNSGDNSLSGGGGNDTLSGGDGNDTLNGGGSSDSMTGGLGNDLYYVDSASDSVVEALGEGADTVSSSISYTAAANVETVILSGSGNTSATGNALDNALTGNGGNNSLSGGDGNDTLSGGNGQDSLDGGIGADSLSGGAGNDAYVVDDAGDVVVETAGQGTDTVSAGIDYALTAEVEHLILTGAALSGTGNSLANAITGTAGNNSLSGADGNDTLDGGAGADTLIGGTGNDSYVVDDAGDVVTEASGEGTDTVTASLDYALTADVENLVLTGAALTGTGNALGNAITGTSGNNVLDGGAGADTLTGGAGDDSYVVDDAGDVVTEASGEGTDTVTASVDYTLTANVENLVLTGAAANGTGNALDNAITGTSGNNVLDGGAGADTLTGGAGDDSYVVDDAGDVVVEASGEGSDTVTASVDYTLTADVENLVLTGSAATGTGNGLDNAITGTSGNNVLHGGAGADTLTGGDGDDSYVVDDAGDVVTEALGEGTDTVTASVDYALTADVENLVLTGSAATGTGNGLDNAITGTSGNNVLDGGAGADTLTGGDGDDSYVVDDAGDVVTEAASEGSDTVSASVDYALTANVENLVLTGSAAIGTGNGLDNAITGTSGANVLTGGAGNDSLTGSAGSDDFVFSDAASNGTDTITDFEQGVDRLVFTGADYGFAASYNLSASEFTVGASAVGTNAQFIWDDVTGHLYWDADGTGAGAAVDLAVITGSVTKDDLYFV